LFAQNEQTLDYIIILPRLFDKMTIVAFRLPRGSIGYLEQSKVSRLPKDSFDHSAKLEKVSTTFEKHLENFWRFT